VCGTGLTDAPAGAGEPAESDWTADVDDPSVQTTWPAEADSQQPLPPLELNQAFPFATGFEEDRPLHAEEATPAPFLSEDEYLASAGEPSEGDHNPERTPQIAAAPALSAVLAPATRLGTRRMAMMGAALFATGGLIFTMMSMRPSASPETEPSVAAAPAAPPRSVPGRVPAAAARTSAPPPSVPMSAWTEVTGGRWTGGARQSVAFELRAVNKIHIWTRAVTPVLVVRCQAGRVEPFVFTQSAARMEPQDGDHTVRLAFDDAQEVTERWPDSDEHDALFARDAAAFTAQLVTARTLRFGFEPHNASPAVAQFQVTGLRELLAGSPRQCGQKR
jgi:hypothetical protein